TGCCAVGPRTLRRAAAAALPCCCAAGSLPAAAYGAADHCADRRGRGPAVAVTDLAAYRRTYDGAAQRAEHVAGGRMVCRRGTVIRGLLVNHGMAPLHVARPLDIDRSLDDHLPAHGRAITLLDHHVP